jgi:hypothetical protein
VLLVSAPYALKAGDAETIGGLPPSAFVLAEPVNGSNNETMSFGDTSASSSSVSPAASSDVTTTGGTVKTIPLFSTATNIQNSLLTQTAAMAVNVVGKLYLPAIGAATKTAGASSRPLDFVASSFSSSTSTAVNQTFQWQAENDTASPSGTLNLLYAAGTVVPAETGLKIDNKGQFTFAAGQTFPGTSTITDVKAGTDLLGGGTTRTVTLNLDTTKVPQLATANTFTANQTITGNLNASGYVDGFGAVFNGSGFPVVYVLENGTSGEALLATSNNVAGGEAVIDGEANGTTGATYGLLGNNLSSSNFAAGVLGQNFSSSSITFGVEGISNSSINGPRGVGVFGVNTMQSNTAGLLMGNNPVGVWGDAGSFGVGVGATADEGYALAATNNSPKWQLHRHL